MTYKIYDPYAIRTHYLSLRRRPLYPSELMDQKKFLLLKYYFLFRPRVATLLLTKNCKAILAQAARAFSFYPSTFLLFNNQFVIFL